MPQNAIGLIDIFRSKGSLRIKWIKCFDLITGTLIAPVLKKKNSAVTQDGTRPRSILVIRPGGIGDAVFLLAVLRSIHRGQPSMVIDILCEKRNVQVFSSQEQFNAVYCYDRPKEFRQVLKKEYDLVFDTEQWHYLSALTAYRIKHKKNIGFATRRLRAKLFNEHVGYDGDAYELENFKRLFSSLLTGDGPATIDDSFAVAEDDFKWACDKIPDKCISVFLGASIAIRRLTEEQSLELIRSGLEKGYHVALLGGTDVERASKTVASKIDDPRLINFTGTLSLAKSAAIIKRCRVFVGPDSGLMHLACAVGTPVIALFGPGRLSKWGPKGERHRVVTDNVECSPCTRFGYTIPTCRKSYHCMRRMRTDIIAQKIY